MDKILKYFPEITENQKLQLTALGELYNEWNAKINVISRKDIVNLYEHHILHSLAIAKAIHFKSRTQVLDFGTGGGFPGIPLAIMFPDCDFKLIDSIGKKIYVVNEVIKEIGLKNCVAEQKRGELETGKYDFVVSRAVMPLPDLIKVITKNILKKQKNAFPNGLICLKGGDITNEIAAYHKIAEVTPISNWFNEEWFIGKNVIYVPI